MRRSQGAIIMYNTTSQDVRYLSCGRGQSWMQAVCVAGDRAGCRLCVWQGTEHGVPDVYMVFDRAKVHIYIFNHFHNIHYDTRANIVMYTLCVCICTYIYIGV